jgi:hypothetical protein
MGKTSKKDFEQFQKSFRKYQERLGVVNYEVIFQHMKLDDNDAELEYFRQPCAVVARLNTEMSDNGRTMDNLAKHEAIELLLAPMRSAATRRTLDEGDLNEICHSVVQALVRVV